MDVSFTVVAGGPGTEDPEFERELGAALGAEVEREGPELGWVADLFAFLVTYKTEIILGLGLVGQALPIVDRLIELAARRGATIKIVDRGREVTVETSRRQEAADLLRAALERASPASG
jgi:hypothetical protein